MKSLFEGQGDRGSGVVDGDTVVDLNVVDSASPPISANGSRRNDGDTKPLAYIAKVGAAAAARRPLSGFTYRLPIGPAGQGHLPRVELSRARQGRRAAR